MDKRGQQTARTAIRRRSGPRPALRHQALRIAKGGGTALADHLRFSGDARARRQTSFEKASVT